MASNSKRKNIGLFVAMLENEFSSAVLEGAYKAAEDMDVNLIVFPVGFINPPVKKKENYRYQYNVLTSFLQANSIDAAILEYGTMVSTIDDTKKKELLSIIEDIPVVLLSEKADGFPSICINNKAGLEEVIIHFIEKHKCKKIAYVSGPNNNHDSIERLNVYKDVMSKYNLYPGDDWIYYGNFSVYTEELVERLLDEHPEVEAIVFANDHMAIGAYPVFEKRNITIGKDILISGFDNISSSVLMEPSLTTVMADTKQLGYDAVVNLVKYGHDTKSMVLNTSMIPRESCGCDQYKLQIHNTVVDMVTDRISDRISVEASKRVSNRLKKEESNIEAVRHETRNKVKEAEKRRNFEIELNNINRQIVYSENADMEWFSSMLYTLKKLEFSGFYVFMYDNYVEHKSGTTWHLPENANLTGYYYVGDNETEEHIYEKGEVPCVIRNLFTNAILDRGNRHNLVVIPLFFKEHQYGLLVAESDIDYFQFAYQIAGQISSTLEIINMLNTQEKIKAELAYANKSKSQFLANMSHEIRTPINAILGMNEMILRENESPDIDKYALNIKSAANTLLGIINDILDFSKIEAGKMSLVEANYSLADLLRDTMTLSNARLNGKELELILDYDENLPKTLYGDDVRIKQVLLNIMSNGIKYTNKGSVTLKVSGHRDGEYSHMTYSVTDTGIGIKEEDLNKLFEEFQRIDEGRNRNVEGTGLGMSITKGLLNLMGSTLKVKSVYNEGSTFSFNIYQKIIDEEPVGKNVTEYDCKKKEQFKQKYTAKGARILVVDDIEINRVIIESLLKLSEIEVCQAESGAECIEKVSREAFDLILLDHMMPEMDGMETFKRLKEMQTFIDNPIPTIALTANAIEGSKEGYLANGFADYISKPVDPDKLDEMIIKYINSDKIKYI